MAACPYAEDGAEMSLGGLAVDIASWEGLFARGLSKPYLCGVSESALAGAVGPSTDFYTATQIILVYHTDVVSYQHEDDLSARFDVTFLTCGYYSFQFPCSIQCPGDGVGLI